MIRQLIGRLRAAWCRWTHYGEPMLAMEGDRLVCQCRRCFRRWELIEPATFRPELVHRARAAEAARLAEAKAAADALAAAAAAVVVERRPRVRHKPARPRLHIVAKNLKASRRRA